MKVIAILADTLCRRFLPPYGGTATIAPNLERLAAVSTVFDNHWCGSAPCMPARRDIFTGRLGFLDRNWGGAEPFDLLFPKLLRERRGIYSRMITDHTFYLAPGGENYHAAFDSWEVIRGQEHDPLVPLMRDVPIPPHRGQISMQYQKNRQAFKTEADFPSPRTYASALSWLELNKGADDFFLWIEGFDPHEPFDQPREYLDLYPDDYQGPEYFWPTYAPCSDPPEALEHLKNRYRATITMTDRWIGKIFDHLDREGLWEDTMVILTTDHGYMFGEHGFMAKNYMPAYNEVFHLPLMIHYPGQRESRRSGLLTQNIDLFPTILDFFGIESESCAPSLHGVSLLPALRGESMTTRDWALFGYYGMSVNITDGRHSYIRAAVREDNEPLFLYTASPSTLRQNLGYDAIQDFSAIESGRFLSWTDYPVLKIPAKIIDYRNESQSFRNRSRYNSEHLLFDIGHDYAQEHPLQDPHIEHRCIEALVEALRRHQAPREQFARLGLPEPASLVESGSA